MKEIIFETNEQNPFKTNPKAQAITLPVPVTRNGRKYTSLVYCCRLNPLKRIILLIKVLLITVFSVFLGLFSSVLRNNWSLAVKGNELITVLTRKISISEDEDINLYGNTEKLRRHPGFVFKYGFRPDPLSPTKLSPTSRNTEKLMLSDVFNQIPKQILSVLSSSSMQKILQSPVLNKTHILTVQKTPGLTLSKSYLLAMAETHVAIQGFELNKTISEQIDKILNKENTNKDTHTLAIVFPYIRTEQDELDDSENFIKSKIQKFEMMTSVVFDEELPNDRNGIVNSLYRIGKTHFSPNTKKVVFVNLYT